VSTATENPTASGTSGADWVPSPLYRMSVEKYEAIAEAGILGKRDRVHLINGYLVTKKRKDPPHSFADMSCGAAFERLLPPDFFMRSSSPIRLPDQASEPEPDRCVVRGKIRDYTEQHPGPADIALVIEVALTTLADDRKLATAVYGPAGIPVYWIIDLVHRQVEVYSNPGPEGYRSIRVVDEGQLVAVEIDGQELGRIAVADVLPDRRPRTEGSRTTPPGETAPR
jgi:Uma2 family endonuclease